MVLIRSLARAPWFFLVAVTTLAVAIAGIAVFVAIADAVLLAPLPFVEPDRIVVLWDSNPSLDLDRFRVSAFNFTHWQQSDPPFESMAIFVNASMTLGGNGADPVRIDGARVSDAWFRILGVPPLLGRTFAPADFGGEASSPVIVSETLWRNRLGSSADAIGATLRLEGDAYTVIGVMPSQPFPARQSPVRMEFTAGEEFFWLPHVPRPSQTGHFQSAIARLEEGVTVESARERMNAIAARLEEEFSDSNEGYRVLVIPVLEEAAGDVRAVIWTLVGSVAVLLLIACANVSGMLLVRATARAKDIGIRAALGAGRARIFADFTREAALLVAFSLAAGAALASLVLRALPSMVTARVVRLDQASLSPLTISVLAVASLFLLFVLTLVPSLQFLRGRFDPLLASRGAEGRGANRGRRALVAAQTALAVVLLIGAGLFARSLLRLRAVDTGFISNGILTFELQFPGSRYDRIEQLTGLFDRLFEGIERIPGVTAVAGSYDPPLVANWTQSFVIDGEPEDADTQALFRTVTPGYFGALGVPLIDGRPFDARDRAGSPGAIAVNEAFVRRYFDGRSPIGRRMRVMTTQWMWGDAIPGDFTVVGVVGNERFGGPAAAAEPAFYIPYAQTPHDRMTVLVRTSGDPRAILPGLRSIVRAIDPLLPIAEITTVEEELASAIAKPRLTAALVGVFAVLALALVLLGIWGVASESARLRTREIGIRIAIGAQPDSIRALILRHALLPAAAGLAAGLLASLALQRLIEGLLFETSPLDLPTWIAGAAAILATAAAASLLPAIRASNVNAAEVLRGE